MYTINLDKHEYHYDSIRKTFIMGERNIPFATKYKILNPKTQKEKLFEFTHSTGPEFDKNTRWVYKSEDGLQLEVCNDEQMTKIAADNYLTAKLRK
jgi:hypothetical protein